MNVSLQSLINNLVRNAAEEITLENEFRAALLAMSPDEIAEVAPYLHDRLMGAMPIPSDNLSFDLVDRAVHRRLRWARWQQDQAALNADYDMLLAEMDELDDDIVAEQTADVPSALRPSGEKSRHMEDLTDDC